MLLSYLILNSYKPLNRCLMNFVGSLSSLFPVVRGHKAPFAALCHAALP